MTEPKKQKKKGPIRFEAIIPVCVIAALFAAYGHFFFDDHLKKGLELASSYAYGAEVNIKHIDISLFSGSIKIDEVQVTDSEMVERNLVQIGQMRFSLLWDALLRAKFVIKDAAIEGLQFHSPRKRPGKIFKSKDDEGPGFLDSAKDKILENAQEQLAGNILGDAAALLDGADPLAKLNEIKDGLLTKKKIDETQATLKQKEDYWQERVKQLPKPEKFAGQLQKLKALKFDINKPQELAQSIETGSNIVKETDQDIKMIKGDAEALKNDVNTISTAVKDIENTTKSDLAGLQTRVALPQLDAKAIALLLFGDQVRRHLFTAEKYAGMAKKYSAQRAAEAEKDKANAITPKERALGKTYKFPHKKSYPMFWLQSASISSKSQNSSFAGDLKGELTDISSDPDLVPRPTVMHLAGDFPHSQILGIDGKITIDHREEVAKNLVTASIKSYPVAGRDFTKSDRVQFGFKQATGSAEFKASLIADQLEMEINNQLQNIDYTVQASSKLLEETLVQVTKDVPIVTVSARIAGPLRSPKISLQTNLASAIQDSLTRQLKARVAEAKEKLQKLVKDQIGAQKEKLLGEFNKFKGRFSKEIDNLKEQAEKAKVQVTAQLDQSKNSTQKKQVEDKVKDEAKKLLKKLKF